MQPLNAWDGDSTQSDAVVCAGGDAYDAGSLRLPAADLVTAARDIVRRKRACFRGYESRVLWSFGGGVTVDVKCSSLQAVNDRDVDASTV